MVTKCLWWTCRALPPGLELLRFEGITTMCYLLYRMSKLLSSNFTWFRLNNVMLHKHHIVPKYLGGTDDPSNLVDLTVDQHAEAHRLLYEQHGNWQDYVAWQGLSKLDANFDAAKQSMIEGGRKGAARSNLRWKDPIQRELASKKMKVVCANRGKTWQGKLYEITHPDGTVETVEGLRQWCLDRGYNPNNFGNACLRGSVTNGGFMVRRV